MGYDLIKIKEKYSETMMHLCRELFPTLLEQEGLLFSLLESKFAYSKFLGEDIIQTNNQENFKEYILNLTNISKVETIIDKNPDELLEEAGYILYKCKNEEDIQSFKKYYAPGEELCTFKNDRLKKCYVFFAIKKNVDKIKREKFLNPERQDEYGTSVISIQFTRGTSNTVSIKNRYNHTVPNPDATFSNNLDNIIPGLTKSFEKEYNLSIVNNNHINFELSDYVLANDGKYYKYNYEINNIYYCPDNIIIDNFNVITDYNEKEKYIVMDYFIVDLVNKNITLYDESLKDSFLDSVEDIKKIEVTNMKSHKGKQIKLIFNNYTSALLELDKTNKILSYEDNNLTEIGQHFLHESNIIENINIPNVTKIEDFFLNKAYSMKKISLPNVEIIGNSFLEYNKSLEEIYLPKVKQIKNGFLSYNYVLEKIDFPYLRQIGNEFLEQNFDLKEVNLPRVTKIGNNFLSYNSHLFKLDLPLLKEVKNNFLEKNCWLKEINLPNLEVIGSCFLESNQGLKKIDLPNVRFIGNNFMLESSRLQEINLPNVNRIGFNFLYTDYNLISLRLTKVEYIYSGFLKKNTKLEILEVPNLKVVESSFLADNQELKQLNLPSLQRAGDNFLSRNVKLNKFYAPELLLIGNDFLLYNKELVEVDFPSLICVGNNFLSGNEKLEYINIPNLERVGNNFLYFNTVLESIEVPNLVDKPNGFLKYNEHNKSKVKQLKWY